MIRPVMCLAVAVGALWLVPAPATPGPDGAAAAPPPGATTAAPDSTLPYSTRHNYVLMAPRLLWTGLVYPVGRAVTYAEHKQLYEQLHALFTNDAGTFGLFPTIQLGGETGTGGGFYTYHTDLRGRGKSLSGGYVYSGYHGQTANIQYEDPNLGGTRAYWRSEAVFLRTHNRNASINAAVRQDCDRAFGIHQLDLQTTLGWRPHAGQLEDYRWNVYAEMDMALVYRDFYVHRGTTAPLEAPGLTAAARQLPGLEEDYFLYAVGLRLALDDRDYRSPAQQVSHPLDFRWPGRAVVLVDGEYHSERDLSYPERGGLLEARGSLALGTDDVRYTRLELAAERYFTLFLPNRILALRSRLEHVDAGGDDLLPYPELVFLGGAESLRGYRRGYFQGRGSLLLTAEYRYPIWDTWHAYVFYEEGQVFDQLDEIAADRLEWSWGGGVDLRAAEGTLAGVRFSTSAVEDLLVGVSMVKGF